MKIRKRGRRSAPPPTMKIRKRGRRSAPPLPDDLVMEILCRMSAHDVLKCRKVCRRWRTLISNQDFQKMHIKARAYHSSMVFIQKWKDLLLLDKWEQPRKRPTIRRGRHNFIENASTGFSEFELSYDGLIVMRSRNYKNNIFIISNPISREAVIIEIPSPLFNVYGMFLNPIIREYCVLFGTYGADMKFLMLNLGIEPSFRALKQSVSFPEKHRNPFCRPPVVIDDATIYWVVLDHGDGFLSCEELIMALDIKSEVFTFLPHPDPIDDCHLLRHWDMNIVNIDGRLSFVQGRITPDHSSLIINMWSLKDTAARVWIKTHCFSIDMDRFNIRILMSLSAFTVMAVGKGELLLQYLNERIYAYSLELGTLRKIGGTYKDSLLSVYVPSFVSLRECKPKICMTRSDILRL